MATKYKNFCIAVMGPDGSGKTTIIKKLKNKLKKKFIKFQYIHLRPKLLKPESSAPVTDPHSKPPRSSFASLLKIVYWLIIYKIFFFINIKKTLLPSNI